MCRPEACQGAVLTASAICRRWGHTAEHMPTCGWLLESGLHDRCKRSEDCLDLSLTQLRVRPTFPDRFSSFLQSPTRLYGMALTQREDIQVAGVKTGVTVVKGVRDALSGKGVELTSDRVSTNLHQCKDEQCPYTRARRSWSVVRTRNWPFRNWYAAQVIVNVVFEYNGCDVNNSRIVLSNRTFNSWYNDGAKYVLTAKGGASRIPGESGCAECCQQSACVEFDVQLSQTWDFVRYATRSWSLRICGDGNVSVSLNP